MLLQFNKNYSTSLNISKYDTMDPLMIIWAFLIGIIFGLIIGLTIVYKSAVYPLKKKIEKIEYEKQQISIQNEPADKLESAMKSYPYDIQNFKFIGNPIDGIQFNDDKILFITFKIDNLKLNDTQRRIKKLIENKKIEWFEFKIK